MKEINVELNKVSLERAIKELKYIRSTINIINQQFIDESLDWIIDRAIHYLNIRVHNFPNTANIQDGKYWHKNPILKEKNRIVYELRNDNEFSAYVEFGTGIVGMQNPHQMAGEVDYKYDINNHGDKGWTFYNENVPLYLKGFTGYEGKSFLYDSMWDYFYKEQQWAIIYNRIWNFYIK